MKIKNKVVADRIGMSESGVWMIRNGRRFPLVGTMDLIAEAYGWSVEDQFAAREGYAEAFEQVLQEVHGREGVHA